MKCHPSFGEKKKKIKEKKTPRRGQKKKKKKHTHTKYKKHVRKVTQAFLSLKTKCEFFERKKSKKDAKKEKKTLEKWCAKTVLFLVWRHITFQDCREGKVNLNIRQNGLKKGKKNVFKRFKKKANKKYTHMEVQNASPYLGGRRTPKKRRK